MLKHIVQHLFQWFLMLVLARLSLVNFFFSNLQSISSKPVEYTLYGGLMEESPEMLVRVLKSNYVVDSQNICLLAQPLSEEWSGK